MVQVLQPLPVLNTNLRRAAPILAAGLALLCSLGQLSASGSSTPAFERVMARFNTTAPPAYRAFRRLDAGVEYTLKTSNEVSTTLFLRGNNLLDQDMRAHTSFIKDFVPMPGRSFVAGLRANF